MQRLKRSGTSIWGSSLLPKLRRKASNSWSAVQDAYLSTKDIFERHRVVFTISTSIASVVTAWAGYSLRYLHQAKVEERLESMEQAMRSNYYVEHDEIKKIVNSGNVTYATCAATAGVSLIIGYGLGWRGGKWYANRKFRKEQMKLLGAVKPQSWQFLRRSLLRGRTTDSLRKASNFLHKDNREPLGSQKAHQSC